MKDHIVLERDVRRFLVENFPLGKDAAELSSTDSLLDAGVIDSTGVLELVGFLEDHYSISISDEELLPENLDSVDTIVQFLQRKL